MHSPAECALACAHVKGKQLSYRDLIVGHVSQYRLNAKQAAVQQLLLPAGMDSNVLTYMHTHTHTKAHTLRHRA